MLSLAVGEPEVMVLQESGIYLEKVWLRPEVECEVFLHLALENLLMEVSLVLRKAS